MIKRIIRSIKIYYYAALLSLFDAIASEVPRLRPWAHRRGDQVWPKFARAKISHRFVSSGPMVLRKPIIKAWSGPSSLSFLEVFCNPSRIEKEVRRFVAAAEKEFYFEEVLIHLQKENAIPDYYKGIPSKSYISRLLVQNGAKKKTKLLYGIDPSAGPILTTVIYAPPAHPQAAS